MSKNRKQSRILPVLLTLEISTVLPDFACSIFRSRPLAVLRYVFACSRLFSLFALMAAFRYCFFLFSRNSSCSLTEKQLYRNTHSSATANAPDTALPCSVYSQEMIRKGQLSNQEISLLHSTVSWALSSIKKGNKLPSGTVFFIKKTSQHFTSVIIAPNLQA